MTPSSPLSRLEKLAIEHSKDISPVWTADFSSLLIVAKERSFLEGGKAMLQILSEPGEACGPLSDPFNSHKYEDLAKEIYAWGNPSTWDVFVRGARSGFRDGRAEATLQARAEIAHLRNRDEGLTAMNKHHVEQLTRCEKALASSEARVRELERALEKIRDHFIPFDRAPSMATQNHFLKDIAREALTKIASVPGTEGEA